MHTGSFVPTGIFLAEYHRRADENPSADARANGDAKGTRQDEYSLSRDADLAMLFLAKEPG